MTRPRARTPLARAALLLLTLRGCSDERRPDGSPCATAFDCASSACLRRPDGARACARRCADTAGCAPGEVCGRHDLRGRDDAGLPAGPAVDVLRACRPPLCAGGACERPCSSRDDCGGRACVASGCARGLCAWPCDHERDCAPGERCDLGVTDVGGHGECVAAGDAAVASDCGGDA